MKKKSFLEIGLQLHPACGKMSTFRREKIPTESTLSTTEGIVRPNYVGKGPNL